MSTWTEVTGIIVCDWCSWSYPDKDKVKEDIKERKHKLHQLFLQNRINGSEGPIHIDMKDYNKIIITGSLRDFDSTDIQEKIAPWWNYIMENIGYVRQAVMSCTSCRKTYIFEKRIAHDADLGDKLLELYGPDPGIFIHTNRKINL